MVMCELGKFEKWVRFPLLAPIFMKILKTTKEWCLEHEVELHDAQDAMNDETQIDLQEFSSVTSKYKSSWKNASKNGFTRMSCGLISGGWAQD